MAAMANRGEDGSYPYPTSPRVSISLFRQSGHSAAISAISGRSAEVATSGWSSDPMKPYKPLGVPDLERPKLRVGESPADATAAQRKARRRKHGSTRRRQVEPGGEPEGGGGGVRRVEAGPLPRSWADYAFKAAAVLDGDVAEVPWLGRSRMAFLSPSAHGPEGLSTASSYKLLRQALQESDMRARGCRSGASYQHMLALTTRKPASVPDDSDNPEGAPAEGASSLAGGSSSNVGGGGGTAPAHGKYHSDSRRSDHGRRLDDTHSGSGGSYSRASSMPLSNRSGGGGSSRRGNSAESPIGPPGASSSQSAANNSHSEHDSHAANDGNAGNAAHNAGSGGSGGHPPRTGNSSPHLAGSHGHSNSGVIPPLPLADLSTRRRDTSGAAVHSAPAPAQSQPHGRGGVEPHPPAAARKRIMPALSRYFTEEGGRGNATARPSEGGGAVPQWRDRRPHGGTTRGVAGMAGVVVKVWRGAGMTGWIWTLPSLCCRGQGSLTRCGGARWMSWRRNWRRYGRIAWSCTGASLARSSGWGLLANCLPYAGCRCGPPQWRRLGANLGRPVLVGGAARLFKYGGWASLFHPASVWLGRCGRRG
eukprot:jgi/Mesvir1/7558/Mv19299-RA.1